MLTQLKTLKNDWPLMVASTIGFALLFGTEYVLFGETTSDFYMNCACFLAALFLPWLLHLIMPSSRLTGLALLGGGYWAVTNFPVITELFYPALLGLLVWKSIEVFYYSRPLLWMDVMPVLLLLMGHHWLPQVYSTHQISLYQPMLHGFLGIWALMAIMGFVSSLISPLKQLLTQIFTMRLIIFPLIGTIIAGVAAFIVLHYWVLAPQLSGWIAVLLGGILLTVALHALEDDVIKVVPVSKMIMALLLVGIATLVASRLCGTFGWIILTLGMVMPCTTFLPDKPKTLPYLSITAIGFLVSRILLQSWLQATNANLTGVNLLHPYVSAAVLAGVILALVLPMLMLPANENRSPITSFKTYVLAMGPMSLFVKSALFLALIGGYFLHTEAMAGLLIALTFAGIGSVFMAENHEDKTRLFYPAVVLFPILTTAWASWLSPIMDIGATATKGEQLVVFAVSLFFMITLVAFRPLVLDRFQRSVKNA